MVTFSEKKVSTIADKPENILDEKKYPDQYILMIEEELIGLKEKMSLMHEQLDASNDNMQSYNEGLLSANEEMQSTNEEMQPVNEELYSVNTDYQLKNKELLALNDDLNNYFWSSLHGQLFVDNNLLLMKFSPVTVKLINLLPGDIGRPLSNISTNIKFKTIIPDIKHVIATGTTVIKEVESIEGLCYQATTMPYIQSADNKRNGAIITFNDITQLKKTQMELDVKNKSLLRINDDLNNFVRTASHDLLAPLANIEMSISLMNEIKVADPELKKSVNIINASVKKFRSLITDISMISKIESDMMTPEIVDVDDILQNIMWSMQDIIKSSGIIIKKDIQVKAILFSKKNLRSILYNLICNSIKFIRETPAIIEICTKLQNNKIIICVQDNGTGIAEKDIFFIW